MAEKKKDDELDSPKRGKKLFILIAALLLLILGVSGYFGAAYFLQLPPFEPPGPTAEEIAAVIKPQFSETEASTITAIVERYLSQDTWKTDLIFQKESFTLLQEILMDAGELEEPVPYEDLVTTEYARKAAQK